MSTFRSNRDHSRTATARERSIVRRAERHAKRAMLHTASIRIQGGAR